MALFHISQVFFSFSYFTCVNTVVVFNSDRARKWLPFYVRYSLSIDTCNCFAHSDIKLLESSGKQMEVVNTHRISLSFTSPSPVSNCCVSSFFSERIAKEYMCLTEACPCPSISSTSILSTDPYNKMHKYSIKQ
jgi:hypothetical protein